MREAFWKKTGKKNKIVYMGLIAVIGLGAVLSFYFFKSHTASDQKNNGRLATTVDVAPIQRTNLIKRISLTGQTVPAAQVDIAAKYQGKVVAVNAALGQNVTPGEALIVQDTGDADISVSQNQAAYQQASADAITTEATFNANLDKARADYDRNLGSYQRNQSLYQAGAISKDALDSSYQQLADARAAVDTLQNQMSSGVAAAIQSSQANALKAQQSVNAAAKQRSDLVLTAPRSGMIGYRQVEVGDMVSVGQKLMSIYDNSQIFVDCQVSEQDLPALSLGMPVNVGVESLGQTIPGQIIYISPASDPTNLTFSLRILLQSPDQAVRSGMFTRTIINSILRPSVLVVPKDTVLEKNGESYVFVMNANHVLERRTVQVGARGDQNVEILSGLQEGEQIALNNLARLRDGLTINPNLVSMDGRGENQ